MRVDLPARARRSDKPVRATLILAHGAGAPMDTPFMNAIAQGLCTRGLTVVRFEFPYMDRRRREGRRAPPDRMPVLEESFRAVALQHTGKAPLFIGGKSMGGRVATHIADALDVRGVFALGYPFHPPQRPDKLRVEHLAALRTPCLIVQGMRDPFGTPVEVGRYTLSDRTELCWLPDGDHSFTPRKSSGVTLEQNLDAACSALAAFVARTR